MYRYKDIRMVHLEITSRCNAACPMCARNVHGAWNNPDLPLDELRLMDIQQIFPVKLIRQLDRIYLCGNYGDPMVARDVMQVLDYFHSVSPDLSLGMHTNGSGRNVDFWTHLAYFFFTPHSRVVFSIDGLEDTNHIYQRRTEWDKIMTAASTFIGAGGNADWEFLLFKHNQHQVDEARELARTMGFKSFQVKKTGRFSSRDTLGWVDAAPVYDLDGSLAYTIEPPDDDLGKNLLYRTEKKRTAKFRDTLKQPQPREFTSFDPTADFGEFGEYATNACIRCKAVQKKEVFINFQGLVFPCCWIGFPGHNWDPNGTNNQIKDRLIQYGLDRIDAKKRTIRDIVEDDLFQKNIPGSWADGQTVEDGKLMICAQHCGSKSHVTGEYEEEIDKL